MNECTFCQSKSTEKNHKMYDPAPQKHNCVEYIKYSDEIMNLLYQTFSKFKNEFFINNQSLRITKKGQFLMD